MTENIFELEKMECSYNGKTVVLRIDKLNIPKGKIVFFIGPSGIGKSTILETLGFMNKTIKSAEKFKYQGYDVSKTWEWGDDKISAFRNRNFSFIFQQTNLMPNFSAHENIITTALFQGVKKEEARKKTIDVIEKMQLPPDDRPISHYSGGQQQRIAFARAILPNFEVLFGDEPTGNLDVNSASNLMEVLSKELRERKSTAIIVSHDMNLSMKYADMIVLIQKQKKESNKTEFYGLINDNSIFERKENNWLHKDCIINNLELENKIKEWE